MPQLPGEVRLGSTEVRVDLRQHLRSDGVAVAAYPPQLDGQPVSPCPHLVQQHGGRRRVAVVVAGVRVHHQVERAVVVQIRHGHAAPVLDVVGARRHSDIDKARQTIRANPLVAQQYLVLVAVPRQVAPEGVGVELAGLVLSDVCNCTQNVRPSEVVLRVSRDPAIGREDVLQAVIVVV